jgi:signal transduction histidine kinase
MGSNGATGFEEAGIQGVANGTLSTRLAIAASILGLGDAEAEAMFAEAWARRPALGRATGSDVVVAGFAETAAIAHALARLAATGRLSDLLVDRLVRRLAKSADLPADLVAFVLFAEAIRDSDLLELPPDHAIEAHLTLLMSFAPVSKSSLWVVEPNGRLRCLLHAGGTAPTRRERATARAVLREPAEETSNQRGFIQAVPVHAGQHPVAALVVRTRPETRERALLFAEEAASILGCALVRRALLERSAEGERRLVESSERRLVRLGLDLHDGPIQELAAFAADLGLLRRQVSQSLGSHEHGDTILGRLDDLQARLVELDRDLREMARSAESSALLATSFPELLAKELEAFSARNEIESEFVVRGRFDSLTSSQRIALLRVVQEALANVRRHSEASRVSVTIFPQRTHIYVEVTDNGCGFDVERTLVQAARRGHLGLVGMSERIRLLGGRFDIQSRRGGPTTISAMLPRWRPAASNGTGEGEPSGATALIAGG